MSEQDDYRVIIEDMEPEPVTRSQLITIINERIGSHWSSINPSVKIEVDIKPEWEKVIREDGSILWDYEKLGWKAMHYRKIDQKGNLIRDWLSFKFLNYKGKKK